MGKLIRAISENGMAVCYALDSTDMVGTLERYHKTSAVVTAAVPQEDILREESRAVVDRAFEGSLPSFLAHFMGGKTISNAEADELKALIDRFREEDSHA